MKRIFGSLTFSLLTALPILAQDHTETYTFNGVNLDIPDGDSVGVINQQTLATGIDSISSLTISVNISATLDGDPDGFNGDLYVYLRHVDGLDTGFSVLLNRVGRTLGRSFGYDDSGGFDITFDEAAPNDVHLYQDTEGALGSTQLTGSWKPDGRLVDPDDVLDTDTRTSLLSSFATLDGDGDWELFLADLNGTSEHTLNSWSLSLTGIPEPGTASLLAVGAVVAGLRRRRCGAVIK